MAAPTARTHVGKRATCALHASRSVGSTSGGNGWKIEPTTSAATTKTNARARPARTLPMLRRRERIIGLLRVTGAHHCRADGGLKAAVAGGPRDATQGKGRAARCVM